MENDNNDQRFESSVSTLTNDEQVEGKTISEYKRIKSIHL